MALSSKRETALHVDTRVLADAFNSAQTFSQHEDLAGLKELLGLLHTSLDAERDHAAEATSLLEHDSIARV
jgi:hypothetical protein